MDRFIPFISIAALVLASAGECRGADEIAFGRDVLPILSDRCLYCHGPDESHREADLRLDQRASATADRGGYSVIAPQDPDASELIKRVTSTEAAERMPPADSHRKPLTASEVEILRKWIAEGAVWGRHWAFEKPRRPPIEGDRRKAIDYFVAQQFKQHHLQFAPAASKLTLLRRVSFDLTGLPPTPEEVSTFLADDSPQAYEKAVDRLLESSAFGERMAMWWLDAARYADTDGFQLDKSRTNWPWRDWVVAAFNDNMPFDRFTIEQFAGDLLPNATPEQVLATCFHRNHMTNGEGGRDPEESRIDYVIDRVNTTGTVWLGLTLGCCQCHSHKFDPISHQDYYSLSAFFDSIDEDGRAGEDAKPYLAWKSFYASRAVDEARDLVKTREQRVEELRTAAEPGFEAWLADKLATVHSSFSPWRVLHADSLETAEGTILTQDDGGIVQASGPHPLQDDYRLLASTDSPITGIRLEVFPHPEHTAGKFSRGASGAFVLTDVKLQIRRRGASQLRDVEIAGAVADAEVSSKTDGKKNDYGRIADTLDDDPRNGWSTTLADVEQPHVAVFALSTPLVLATDEQLIFTLLHRSTEGDANIGRFRLSVTDQPGEAVKSLDPMPLEALVSTAPATPDDIPLNLRDRLRTQFLYSDPRYQEAKTALDDAKSQFSAAKDSAGKLNVMVLKERAEPRETHVLERGVWDNKGEIVSRAFPTAVLEWPPERSQTRLDLAAWIVSPDNPLTSRVVVNQLWQLCFGAGLVRTPDDFGLQGEAPTHPDLLDWLAVEFVESGWDVKQLLRTVVLSRTYCQSSAVTPTVLECDPENRLLARGARYRLPSWMIRDAALQASGLLNTAVGGPPVMPYQPDGVWEEISMGRFHYEASQGAAQYRRTLYAFWRRSVAPTFLFDNAQRRTCEVRARHTNTPLQALTLLNDITQLEAARELARHALAKHDDQTARLTLLCQRVLLRSPDATELAVLNRELVRAREYYQSTPTEARTLLNFGQFELRDSDNPTELAALMIVASMVFNLDEAITHE